MTERTITPDHADDVVAELARVRAQVAESAHDLSNILGAALNYSGFLSEDLADSPQSTEYLTRLESAVQRAVSAVDHLRSATLLQATQSVADGKTASLATGISFEHRSHQP